MLAQVDKHKHMLIALLDGKNGQLRVREVQSELGQAAG